MLLEKRLVKILNDHNIFKGSINRNDFVDYILRIKWPRINYLYYKDNAFRRKIESAIDDCIEYKFIIDKITNINVTTKGRDYIKILGFAEEILKRRKRTIVNFVVALITVVITAIITLLLNHYANKFLN